MTWTSREPSRSSWLKDFYSEVPHNLADYDPTKLRVSKGDVVPKDAVPLLPAEAAGYLRHFRTQIERSSEDIEQRAAEGLLPEPYWDPTLKRDKSARHDLSEPASSQHTQLSKIDQGSSGSVFRAQEGQ